MFIKERSNGGITVNSRLDQMGLEDPLGYVNGANVYQFELSDPIVGTDPTGLADQPTTQPVQPGGGDLLHPSGKPTTQVAPPEVEVIVGKGNPFFIVKYHGKGIPTFQQQVFIQPADGSTVSPAVIKQEKDVEHGGKDPFEGYVGDNECKTDPSNTTYGKTKNGGDPNNPRKMTDVPSFKIYPSNFSGTKYFVTTVLGPDGKELKTIYWHVTDTNGKVGDPVIDSQE